MRVFLRRGLKALDNRVSLSFANIWFRVPTHFALMLLNEDFFVGEAGGVRCSGGDD